MPKRFGKPCAYSIEGLDNGEKKGESREFRLEIICLTFNAPHYILRTVIKSFKCPDTEKLFRDERVPRFVKIQDTARRKLLMVDAAKLLTDLRVPPGNRLEKLSADREGQHSIRINDQWRVCFVWNENDAHHVEIVDYHD